MSQIVYSSGCDQALNTHTCDPCPVGEGARVSSILVVDDTVSFTDTADLEEWQAKILDGTILMIPEVRGSFDGGQPEFKPGHGRVQEKVSRYKFSLEYLDPTLISNYTFYNALKNVRNKRCWYATENYIWMSDRAAAWAPSAPVSDNTQDDVEWNVKVTWVSGNLPEPVAIPTGIIACYTVED
jgi:hypothetical protein